MCGAARAPSPTLAPPRSGPAGRANAKGALRLGDRLPNVHISKPATINTPKGRFVSVRYVTSGSHVVQSHQGGGFYPTWGRIAQNEKDTERDEETGGSVV